MLKIEGHETQMHKTLESGATISYLHATTNATKITPDKTSLAINEVATISLQWLVFDLTTEAHINDTANTAPFNVTVNGQVGDITPTNGAGEFTFSSAEAGTYKIIVNGEEIGVVVNA
jgi:Flp pilus assembly protein TadG